MSQAEDWAIDTGHGAVPERAVECVATPTGSVVVEAQADGSVLMLVRGDNEPEATRLVLRASHAIELAAMLGRVTGSKA